MRRRIVLVLGALLWGVMTFLTLLVLFDRGPDVLVLISLVVVTVMGAGIFGSLLERPGRRR
jgi:hypothetical protein